MSTKPPNIDFCDAEILLAIKPVLERIRAAAYEAGQQDALAALIQSAQNKLQNANVFAAPSDAPPDLPTKRPAITRPKERGRTRTPNGVIPKMIEEIVNASPKGIRQGEIIERAMALHDFTIKRSSLRVALDSLVRNGRIVNRDGSWFPKGNGT